MNTRGALVDAEHWDELQSLFDRFENTAPSEREKELQAGCTDPRLRHRVLALLHAADAVAVAGAP